MASSTTSTLSPWERLPDELLLPVLEHVMRWGDLKEWCGAVRGVSRQWRAVHDGACTSLDVLDGVTDEGMHALCARLPALTHLRLQRLSSLSVQGMHAVGGLTALTYLCLDRCHVYEAGMRKLLDLPAHINVHLSYCTKCEGRRAWTPPVPHHEVPHHAEAECGCLLLSEYED
jgi:hypothetical protein